MDIVIAYDISTVEVAGERRLMKVARVCEQYGTRVQKSVFEARLSDAQLQRLVIELEDLIDERFDSVIIYRLTGELAASRQVLGRDAGHRLGTSWIF